MDVERCVSCGAIIPEGTQVCMRCLSTNCVQCDWDSTENCRACKRSGKDDLAIRLSKILRIEARRIGGIK